MFDQLAFWEDDVNMCGNSGVKRCTLCLWVSIHVSRSTGKLSVTTMIRRVYMPWVGQRQNEPP